MIVNFLKQLFGLFVGGSGVNNAGGLMNHAALIAAGTWTWAHWDESVTFTASVGTCALIIGVAYLALESMRRSRPNG